ncbi:exodeoxyribonuclease VII small subunit [Vagococcus silagei]|uniref:Exodeoxyribonuclease 7 small subunit n=1 Tax=Vagococcus silagei TaxID=2508885 RepID=A0A4S3B4W0_9ENTE|nr:exodeoxyribonuclease VII small subunit [Vagococcus silagei]THB60860.1 exodeoxyribonuclease VII small subunit [Vagococcus silagei]
MEKKKQTFEESLLELEDIVKQLEMGEVPLEEALDKFKKGIEISKECQKTLAQAEKTITLIATENGEEVPFEGKGE